MKISKSTVIKYTVTMLAGAAIAFGTMCARGLFSAELPAERYMYISDGLFVCGILLVGFGAMVWIASTGFFDIFSYAFRSLIYLFTPLRSRDKKGKYIDYHQSMEEKRAKDKKGAMAYVLICGLVFLAAAVVFYWLYSRAL